MIKKLLRENRITTNGYSKLSSFKFKYLTSDKKIVEQVYKYRFNRKPNLRNPKTFNEKLQWLKLYWHNPILSKCADKYSVRAFVHQKGLSSILNDVYKVYEAEDDINLMELPTKFVMKATHGSGWNIICENKNVLNWDKEKVKIRNWLNTNYFYYGREWAYKHIKPRIICEKFLEDENGQPPKDYKIFCFNGVPRFIQVDLDRFSQHKRNMYDLSWNLLDFELLYTKSPEFTEKPQNLEKMIEIAKKLSEDFPFVRVDLYNINGKILFGELTFYPGNGQEPFYPIEYDEIIGDYLILQRY